MNKNSEQNLLYREETYAIRGICYKIYKQYRNAYKENIYHTILYKELMRLGFHVEKNKQIAILHNGEKVGTYIPDLIINGKILIELKTKPTLLKQDLQQFWYYLKGSSFRVGLLVNFGASDGVQIIRRVYG